VEEPGGPGKPIRPNKKVRSGTFPYTRLGLSIFVLFRDPELVLLLVLAVCRRGPLCGGGHSRPESEARFRFGCRALANGVVFNGRDHFCSAGPAFPAGLGKELAENK